MTKLAIAAAIYVTLYWAYRLYCARMETKNKRKALATLKPAGIPVVCVCGWRNETHEGPCTPYSPGLTWSAPKGVMRMTYKAQQPKAPECAPYMDPQIVEQFQAKMRDLTQPKAPACGLAQSCNSCHTCPDLTALPAIDTTKDSKLYMRGFEDGQAVAQARMQSDKDALERHWKGNG